MLTMCKMNVTDKGGQDLSCAVFYIYLIAACVIPVNNYTLSQEMHSNYVFKETYYINLNIKKALPLCFTISLAIPGLDISRRPEHMGA